MVVVLELLCLFMVCQVPLRGSSLEFNKNEVSEPFLIQADLSVEPEKTRDKRSATEGNFFLSPKISGKGYNHFFLI